MFPWKLPRLPGTSTEAVEASMQFVEVVEASVEVMNASVASEETSSFEMFIQVSKHMCKSPIEEGVQPLDSYNVVPRFAFQGFNILLAFGSPLGSRDGPTLGGTIVPCGIRG